MRALLRGMFLENVGLKAISLFLALTLFIVVRSEGETQAAIDVPVVYDLAADRVLTSDPPSSVRLVVRGPWDKLSDLDATSLAPIEVDLARVGEGDFRLTPELIALPPGVTVLAFSPPSVRLSFEPRVTRTLNLVAALDGAPAYGYRVAGTHVTPGTVQVIGPKPAIDTLGDLATAPVAVDGRSSAFTADAVIAPLPLHVSLVGGPVHVAVAIDVRPELAEQDVPAVPVRIDGLRHLTATIEPAAVRVTLHGERLATDRVDRASLIATVDGAALELLGPGAHDAVPAVPGLPAGVAAAVDPPTVRVTLR